MSRRMLESSSSNSTSAPSGAPLLPGPASTARPSDTNSVQTGVGDALDVQPDVGSRRVMGRIVIVGQTHHYSSLASLYKHSHRSRTSPGQVAETPFIMAGLARHGTRPPRAGARARLLDGCQPEPSLEEQSSCPSHSLWWPRSWRRPISTAVPNASTLWDKGPAEEPSWCSPWLRVHSRSEAERSTTLGRWPCPLWRQCARFLT